jgi:hypothetical protein
VATLKMKTTAPRLFIDRLKAAERDYAHAEKPAKDGQIVRLAVDDILIDTALFQPREFSYGWKEADPKHVERLARAVRAVGELDPISVVKLKDKWFCVDGHHRLEAYKLEERKEPIDCFWATGETLRDVIVSAMKANSKVSLSLDNTARQNAAWTLTLLGGMSKRQLVETGLVGEGQVARMRRVAKAFTEPGPVMDRLRQLTRRGDPMALSCLVPVLSSFQ